ncbi:hypothetical protein DMY64_06570 [Shigella flexneri]|nr:hypothetical protein [Shigella flexneri]EGD9850348.1 hypothetical protein [Shigella flexneri]EGE1344739.1 hypothetical protein [Shigella flexneri]EGE1604042.1 hypothetical protein [Shigella flexneri]MJP52156.1 hypothetical protein [Shigella flexneri]
MLTISQIINISIISSNHRLFAINFVGLFVGYLYSKMALVHLFPPMQDDKYHGRIENHQSSKSLEFHTVPFILPYHFAKF